jgi:exopolysaccharide biosynthesis polyprenyl glycosylphosphotransferase
MSFLNSQESWLSEQEVPLASTGAAAPSSPAVEDSQLAADSGGVDFGVQGSAFLSRLQARRDAVSRRLLALADVLAAAGSLVTSSLGNAQIAEIVFALLLIVLMGKILGIYDREQLLVRKSTLDEAPALFQLSTLYALTIWLVDGFVISGGTDRRELVILWISLFVLLVALRAVARALIRRVVPPERFLVLGDKSTSDWMQAKLTARRALHAHVVGCVTPGDLVIGGNRDKGGMNAERLRSITSALRVDRVVVMSERAEGEEVLNIIRTATLLGVKVSVLPRILEVIGSSVEFDDVEGLPLLSVRRIGFSRSSLLVKRLLDLAGATLGLTVLAPLMAVIAVAIKVDSRGAVFFRQQRIGRNGKPFVMLKFRTMNSDADQHKEEIRHLSIGAGLFKMMADPRTTRVGRVLRRASLDELPQLLNVFRGEMSLVGPRPLIAEEDSQIEGWRRRRLKLTPGMTGHWQILGSARIPLNEMVRIDYLYVINWSLWLDVKILLRTVPYVLGRKGL